MLWWSFIALLVQVNPIWKWIAHCTCFMLYFVLLMSVSILYSLVPFVPVYTAAINQKTNTLACLWQVMIYYSTGPFCTWCCCWECLFTFGMSFLIVRHLGFIYVGLNVESWKLSRPAFDIIFPLFILYVEPRILVYFQLVIIKRTRTEMDNTISEKELDFFLGSIKYPAVSISFIFRNEDWEPSYPQWEGLEVVERFVMTWL